MWRLVGLAWVVGVAVVQLWPALPGPGWAWLALGAALGLAAVAVWQMRAQSGVRQLGWLLVAAAMLAGSGHAMLRAEWRLADALAPEHENLVTRLEIEVVSLATAVTDGQRFEARVLASPVSGMPSRISVAWYVRPGQPVRMVLPGERYSAALVLRRPHGVWNPHGFDAQAWMFERGLRASATVRGRPQRLGDEPWSRFETAVQRVRHHLRASLLAALQGLRHGPVIVALAMGDQAGVEAADWEAFNRLGITHLVSISGLHVTLLAALVASLVRWLYVRVSWRGVALAERLPAQVPTAILALAVAWAYCLVAGWGVPAQRTFFMLVTLAVVAVAGWPWLGTGVLTAAAVVVTLLDPWAVLAPGFWLSFGAVGLLMLAGSGRWQSGSRWRWLDGLTAAVRLQLAISLALVPLLAWQFHSVSLASPLANALAIPLVSLVITPLALAAMLLCVWPFASEVGAWCARLAEWLFRLMMQPLEHLLGWAWASVDVAAPSWPVLGLGMLAVLWRLLPAGLPGRHACLLLLVPLFLPVPSRLPVGAWRLAALDVGQGGGVVIHTARHVLVYDTGPRHGSGRDAGERVLWPYLRAQGVRRIDDLVISHGDADHAGGLASLHARLPVQRQRASYAAGGDVPAAVCRAGQGWWLDGVAFTFLHPDGVASAPLRNRNARSCVLRIQGLHHSALLTGDIGTAQETALARAMGAGLAADVVLMAHHGSRSSSAASFVRAVNAQHAIAQVGRFNAYGHPHAQVQQRWERSGTTVHRSDWHGAVLAESVGPTLRVVRQREAVRRYWHGR